MTALARRRRPRTAGFRHAGVTRAGWLGPGVILFTHTVAARPSEPDPTAGAARWLVVADRWLCAAELEPEMLASEPARLVVLRGRDDSLSVGTSELSDALTDLRTLVREELAGTDLTTRTAILAFLAALPGVIGQHASLAPGLRQAREMLRERHPIVTAASHAEPLAITGACRVDAASVFICGTVAAGARAVTALSPEGERLPLRAPADGAFATLLTARSSHDAGWIVTLEREDGTTLEAPALSLEADAAAARAAILGARAAGHGDRAEADRAIELIQRRRRDAALPAAVETFGSLPDPSPVAIVLSLGESAELLEHHLAALAADPVGRGAELIIALDAPSDPERERWRVAQLHELYGLPLTLAMARAPAGPALLRAVGGEVATAARLLLLQAGLLSAEPASLSTLIAFADALGDDAALAAKRVRPDASLPDAGYTFAARPDGGWSAIPRLAGVHADAPPANVTEPVIASGTAGLLVPREAHAAAAREVWRYVGDLGAGLELSLALARLGVRTWHVPRAVLADLAPPAATAIPRGAVAHDRDLLSRMHGGAIAAAVETAP